MSSRNFTAPSSLFRSRVLATGHSTGSSTSWSYATTATSSHLKSSLEKTFVSETISDQSTWESSTFQEPDNRIQTVFVRTAIGGADSSETDDQSTQNTQSPTTDSIQATDRNLSSYSTENIPGASSASRMTLSSISSIASAQRSSSNFLSMPFSIASLSPSSSSYLASSPTFLQAEPFGGQSARLSAWSAVILAITGMFLVGCLLLPLWRRYRYRLPFSETQNDTSLPETSALPSSTYGAFHRKSVYDGIVECDTFGSQSIAAPKTNSSDITADVMSEIAPCRRSSTDTSEASALQTDSIDGETVPTNGLHASPFPSSSIPAAHQSTVMESLRPEEQWLTWQNPLCVDGDLFLDGSDLSVQDPTHQGPLRDSTILTKADDARATGFSKSRDDEHKQWRSFSVDQTSSDPLCAADAQDDCFSISKSILPYDHV